MKGGPLPGVISGSTDKLNDFKLGLLDTTRPQAYLHANAASQYEQTRVRHKDQRRTEQRFSTKRNKMTKFNIKFVSARLVTGETKKIGRKLRLRWWCHMPAFWSNWFRGGCWTKENKTKPNRQQRWLSDLRFPATKGSVTWPSCVTPVDLCGAVRGMVQMIKRKKGFYNIGHNIRNQWAIK